MGGLDASSSEHHTSLGGFWYVVGFGGNCKTKKTALTTKNSMLCVSVCVSVFCQCYSTYTGCCQVIRHECVAMARLLSGFLVQTLHKTQSYTPTPPPPTCGYNSLHVPRKPMKEILPGQTKLLCLLQPQEYHASCNNDLCSQFKIMP